MRMPGRNRFDSDTFFGAIHVFRRLNCGVPCPSEPTERQRSRHNASIALEHADVSMARDVERQDSASRRQAY